ncbi:hypothetical protein KSF_093980 [Reticulibacter mediterranei]|uniref:Right handed beta helix domain-containing protein n=1 Tax=Reticulibacter mediterranei TaxID=2778369 RepID=A0A8J3IVP5_9CHLR|nr:right-handed parallel beta-helix repeat-containing protein [Reticulibacter mediterranei]GHO99350.1 hypothetical protein KSF_093980 [Reticulibacter mediterranei]
MSLKISKVLSFCLLFIFTLPLVLSFSQQSAHGQSRVALASCTGIAVQPGDNIQTVVDSHPEGTTFCFSNGVYTGQQVYPKTGDSFLATDGQAKLDGQGKTFAFRSRNGADNVTIQGLEITGYLSEKQWGVIDSDHPQADQTTDRSEGWKILFNNVHHNGGTSTGVRVGPHSLVRGNLITYNGMMGIGGSGEGSVWEYNDIGWNNTAHNDYGFEAGGSKFALTTNTIVQHNYVHENYGPGLWSDIANRNIKYLNNVITDNISTGIFHEISYDVEIANNYIARNSVGNVSWLYGDGILLSTSQNADVHDNWLEDNAMGIIETEAKRGSDWKTAHNHVYNNHIASKTGYTGLSQQDPGPDVTTADNWFKGNIYYTDQQQAWHWMTPMDFKTWQSKGQDVDGSTHPRSAWPGKPQIAVGPQAFSGNPGASPTATVSPTASATPIITNTSTTSSTAIAAPTATVSPTTTNTPTTSPTPADSPTSFSDQFSSSTLQDGWTFSNTAGNGNYSLSNKPGYLQINALTGTGHDCWENTANCIRMTRLLGNNDGTYETKIDGDSLPSGRASYGLLLWQDAKNFVRFEIFSQTLSCWKVINGTGAQCGSYQKITIGPQYIQVKKTGANYGVAYSNDGKTWAEAFGVDIPAFTISEGGVTVNDLSNDPNTTGNFDYFTYTPTTVPKG